jgi:hypothetical protein
MLSFRPWSCAGGVLGWGFGESLLLLAKKGSTPLGKQFSTSAGQHLSQREC